MSLTVHPPETSAYVSSISPREPPCPEKEYRDRLRPGPDRYHRHAPSPGWHGIRAGARPGTGERKVEGRADLFGETGIVEKHECVPGIEQHGAKGLSPAG